VRGKINNPDRTLHKVLKTLHNNLTWRVFGLSYYELRKEREIKKDNLVIIPEIILETIN